MCRKVRRKVHDKYSPGLVLAACILQDLKDDEGREAVVCSPQLLTDSAVGPRQVKYLSDRRAIDSQAKLGKLGGAFCSVLLGRRPKTPGVPGARSGPTRQDDD